MSKRSRLNKRLRKIRDRNPEPKNYETSDGYAKSMLFRERVGEKQIARVRKPKKKRELEIWEENKKGTPEILVTPPGSGKKR